MTIGRLYVPLDVDYADNPKMIGVGEQLHREYPRNPWHQLRRWIL